MTLAVSLLHSTVDAADVRELAERLSFDLSEREAEGFAAAVNDLLPGYAAVDGLSGPREYGPYAVAGLTFDPGPDEDPLNAFVSRFEVPGEGGPLAGLEVAVKDNMAVAGVPMTCGTRAFEAAVPQRNAAVVARLRDAGARLVGKTNMDELAYGPTSETSQFGPVANPADEGHVAGGSSSGSAAAVAAGDADAALGSDTGGSIRIPASFCGCVGFKPTWGVVPRFGFVELAYTLDHIGPLARDVETAARVFDAIAGFDRRDPSSARADRLAGDPVAAAEDAPSVDELSLGVPEELVAAHVVDGVADRFETALDALEARGADLEPVSLPTVAESVAVWDSITNTEFASVLLAGGVPVRRRATFDPAWQDAAAAGIRTGGFGNVVRRKALLGAHLLLNYDARHYVRARNACRRLYREFETALDGHDALVSPTMPVTAPALGEWGADPYGSEGGMDVPLAFNTRPADLVGMPAISVPGGTAGGLPVGVQFVGHEFEDAAVLAVGRTFERFADEAL